MYIPYCVLSTLKKGKMLPHYDKAKGSGLAECRAPGPRTSGERPPCQRTAAQGLRGILGIWGLGFRVWGLGFRVWGLGFGFWGFGFRVWGLGLGVWDLFFGVRLLGFGVCLLCSLPASHLVWAVFATWASHCSAWR